MDFTLRTWYSSDLDSLVECANNPDIAKNMMDGFAHPYTEENGKAFIQFATSANKSRVFAIVINGKAVGSIGIHLQTDISRKNAELGYWLAEAYWGKGVISKAIPQIVEYGFKNLEIERIFARPFGTNIASQKVLEKCGFRLEARFEKTIFKNGEYQDELVYAIRK